MSTLKFSPVNNLLSFVSFDNKIILWNIDKGNILPIIDCDVEVKCNIDFSHDGKFLISGGGL